MKFPLANSTPIQKFVRSLILLIILQHFITIFAPGLLYEIYLFLTKVDSSTENPWLLTDLNWKYPFHAILYSIFFIFHFLPLDLANLIIVLSFLLFTKKMRQVGKWGSTVLFLLSIAVAITVGACFWGVVYWWYDYPRFSSEVIAKFEVLRPGASSNLIHLILGNCLFMCIFLPFWHLRLKLWRNQV